jgi:hypothetical protein
MLPAVWAVACVVLPGSTAWISGGGRDGRHTAGRLYLQACVVLTQFRAGISCSGRVGRECGGGSDCIAVCDAGEAATLEIGVDCLAVDVCERV